MASRGESDDAVRILKDIRDEIRNARNEYSAQANAARNQSLLR
ncbi:MAG TPA: hypothetical protein VFG23_21075 [Polyangia bacterium]|nr:hypothetical protein [Polyangia bacterium]